MKFRSYNQEILIAQALIGNVFNDIVIDRREHGLDRDYSKPISMTDIIQKNIQIPCIFGDRSLILKSLQNQSGAIKLPLYILTSKGLKTDIKREADLHVDIFYQQDECFSKLPKDHPAYRPYSLKKRRGLPIIIDYDLTLITKYKEDLDQMLTNWMVHWRPDIYVKWWHPKKKTEPLQSEILWNQSISIDANIDNDGKSKFQWKASTSFEFKTWIFPGMNYQEDSIESDLQKLGKDYEPIIQKFNIFNSYNYDFSDDVEIDQNTGFPVLGDLFQNTNPNKQDTIQFQAVNDQTLDLDQIYNYQLSSQNYPGYITDQKWFKDAYMLYHKYSDMMIMPPVINDRIQIKYTYFNNALPLSAMNANPPSGDILFNIFSKEIKTNTLDIVDREFGDCYSDSLEIQYEYDIQKKQLNVFGQKKNNTYYTLLKSINSKNQIYQQLLVSGLTLQDNIRFNMFETLNINQEKCINKKHNHNNIALWNVLFDKRQHMNNMQKNNWQVYQRKDVNIPNTYEPKFMIENPDFNHKLAVWRKLFIDHFDGIELQNQQNNTYKLLYPNNNFWKITKDFNCSKKDLQILQKKIQIKQNNINYVVLVNNWLYIVLTQQEKLVQHIKKTENTINQKTIQHIQKYQKNQIVEDVYDFGFVSLPTFDTVPIFNPTIPQSKVVYGLNTQYCIGKIIIPKNEENT